MKHVRPERWGGQFLVILPRPPTRFPVNREGSSRAYHQRPAAQCRYYRQPHDRLRKYLTPNRSYSSAAAAGLPELPSSSEEFQQRLEDLPSPPISQAFKSAKLSALHSRLALPRSLPLETLARCLVDATADRNPDFNNTSLAVLGADLLGYHTAEQLLCNYPRLPISVIFAAQNAYVGPQALADIVRNWGVEAVAEPGGEVDPGLLQFKRTPPGGTMPKTQGLFEGDTSRINKDNAWSMGTKRGMGARIVADDQFGDFGALLKSDAPRSLAPVVPKKSEVLKDGEVPPPSLSRSSELLDGSSDIPLTTDLQTASATFFRALTGAIAMHTNYAAAKDFHAQHILSRYLDLASLFVFRFPTRDLSRLCAREAFESPVARLLSETGRHSIAPVFVVGVYSGVDKLGEGAGPSLDEARTKAAANALRGWYLYRPGEVTKPSDVEGEQRVDKRWIPNYVDCGEVVT